MDARLQQEQPSRRGCVGDPRCERRRRASRLQILDELDRELILKAFEKANGVKTETARLLGVKTSALYYKLEKYGIR